MLVEERTQELTGINEELRQEIADRQQAEEALRESEEQYRMLFEYTQAAILITGPDGIVVSANPALAEMLGYQNPKEMIGEHVSDYYADPIESGTILAELMEKGFVGGYETTLKRRDGSVVYTVGSATVVKDDSGNVQRIEGIFTNITGRKQAEEALRESEEKYRQLFELESDAIFLVENETGRLLEVNAAGSELYGYSQEELRQKKNTDLSAEPDETRKATTEGWTQVPVRYHRRKDGTVFPVEITGRHFTWRGREVHIAAIRDITERMLAEEALRKSQSELATIFDSAPIAMLVVGENGEKVVVRRANDAAHTLARRERGEMVGAQPGGALGCIYSLDDPRGCGFGPACDTCVIRNTVLHTLKTGKAHRQVDASIRPVGAEEDVHVFLSTTLMESAKGEILVCIENVTERKQAEEELKEYQDHLEELVEERTAELREAYSFVQALSRAKDSFLASIGHELRTPITNVKLHQYLLETDPDGRDENLAVLRRETDRLYNIIEDVLYLSSLDQETGLDVTTVDLNSLIGRLTADRTPLAEERGLELSFCQQADLPPLQGDGALLERALSILLSNALNYTPTGGRVEVSTQARELEGKPWVSFSVSDTGPGIPPDEQPHVFERFFRGRVSLETGTPGSGLGLATAKQIVDRHAGRMEVESEGVPGKGATFGVWLPAN